MARRATIIRQEREQAEHILVLDAGNSLLKDRDPAKSTRGRSSIEAMNMMGYDAMTLGLLDLSSLKLDELRQRIGEAKFAVLSANAYVTGTEALLAEPYVVIAMAEHRVGILGLTGAGLTSEVVATDPLEAAKKWIPKLQSQADMVIVLSHAGLNIDEEIAAQVPGIDVIVSGRNRMISEPLVSEGTGTILLHADRATAGAAGERVGVAHLSFDKSGQLAGYNWRNIYLDSTYADDVEMNTWLETLKMR